MQFHILQSADTSESSSFQSLSLTSKKSTKVFLCKKAAATKSENKSDVVTLKPHTTTLRRGSKNYRCDRAFRNINTLLLLFMLHSRVLTLLLIQNRSNLLKWNNAVRKRHKGSVCLIVLIASTSVSTHSSFLTCLPIKTKKVLFHHIREF